MLTRKFLKSRFNSEESPSYLTATSKSDSTLDHQLIENILRLNSHIEEERGFLDSASVFWLKRHVEEKEINRPRFFKSHVGWRERELTKFKLATKHEGVFRCTRSIPFNIGPILGSTWNLSQQSQLKKFKQRFNISWY